jgi:hypothetical protein
MRWYGALAPKRSRPEHHAAVADEAVPRRRVRGLDGDARHAGRQHLGAVRRVLRREQLHRRHAHRAGAHALAASRVAASSTSATSEPLAISTTCGAPPSASLST